MKSVLRLAALAVAVVLSGCAINKQIGYPDSTSNKGKKVTASLTHFNIFLLAPPDNLDKLMDDLSEQCGNNKVVGVSFNHIVRWLLIGELNTIEVAGRCAE